MLLQQGEPSARRAVYMIFAGERVRREDSEPAPELGAYRVIKGIRLIPIPDLVRMKLTSFRLKDKVHIQDLDKVGLITSEIEAGLPEHLRHRLAEVRATE